MKNRQIHIGFSTARRWNPFSALIKWWWGTDYSHVYVRWSTPWGFDEILEASGTSVKMIEASRWSKKSKVIKEYSFDVDKATFGKLMADIRPLTGLPYGWSQALGIAVAELFKLDRNPLDSGSKAFVCSEVAMRALKVLGLDVDKNYDLVSPKDLMDFLEKEH
jgi:hypothetical protein